MIEGRNKDSGIEDREVLSFLRSDVLTFIQCRVTSHGSRITTVNRGDHRGRGEDRQAGIDMLGMPEYTQTGNTFDLAYG